MLSAVLLTATSWAAEPEYEFRATWFTTSANLDWPKTSATTDAKRQQQQKELTNLLDKLVASHINVVLFQVRGRSDAFYASSYEPWAHELTGTRGKHPGYDPLAFAIEEAHKRGLELHAWVNPFRVSNTTQTKLDASKINSLYTAPYGKQKLQYKWVLNYDEVQIIDPGYPEARQYVNNVIMEIVNKYDIDGIVMDDYFYPYEGTSNEDATSQSLYFNANNVTDVNRNGSKVDDWRRANVDDMVKTLYNDIQQVKPWVRFGMGPGGVWTKQQAVYTAYGLTKPSTVDRAMDPYALLYCNTVEWIKNGWVDYVNPQIYWATTATVANYNILCQWWAGVCEKFSNQLPNGKRVHFFPSMDAGKVYNLDESGKPYEGFTLNDPTEMKNQINTNRNNLSSGYTGEVYFRNEDFAKMANSIVSTHYQHIALVPPMAWKSKSSLSAPTALSLQNGVLSWQHASATRFIVYVYPQSVSMETAIQNRGYIHQVIYGKSIDISGINMNTHNVAVRTYDRYGVLHAAKEYASSITWVLNGGKVTQAAPVPSQEELWSAFNTAAGLGLGTLSGTELNTIAGKLTADNLNTVFNKSDWKWLKQYIQSAHTAQKGGTKVDSKGTTRTIVELNGTIESSSTNTINWRYSVAAFFKQSQHAGYPNATANFATAGQPGAWGSAYQAAHQEVEVALPDYVSSNYTLPTPTKAGVSFVGWYDNPNGIGTPLTVLPAGYTGKVYAIWSDTPPPAGGPVTWVLNGGHVNMPIPVPTQEELWTSFKAADAALSGLGTLAEITAKGEGKPHNDGTQPCACRIICAKLTAEVVTAIFSKTEWQWLKTYIMGVQTSLSEDLTEWRYAIAAFFLQSTHSTWPVSADFSTAGKPEAWGSAYQATQAGEDIALPTYITTDYVLPTPNKDGYLFLGWYDNSAGTGEPLTVLPAGYSGSVYAIWGAIPSDIEEVRPALNMNAPMYDLLGRRVDANYRGIVIQNNNKYLIR